MGEISPALVRYISIPVQLVRSIACLEGDWAAVKTGPRSAACVGARRPWDLDAWDAASENPTRPDHPDWQALLVDRGYAGAVDFPICIYYAELAAAFPDAKIALAVRPSGAWFRSWVGIINLMFLEIRRWGWAAPRLRTAGAWTTRAVFGPLFGAWDLAAGGALREGPCVATYEAHNAAVVKTIPPKRLLVYELGSGWAPLCAFLGLPVPDVPYPRVNAAGGMVAFFARGRHAALAHQARRMLPVVVAAAVAVAVALRRSG